MKLTEKDWEDAENALRMHQAKFPTRNPTPFHSSFEDVRDMRDPGELGAALLALRVNAKGVPRKGPLSALLRRYVGL